MAEAHEPWWKNATGDAPGPVLLLFLVGWHNAATRRLLDDEHHCVDKDVRADTGDKTIGDRVCEGHDRDREERRDRVPRVAPVDVLGSLSHERSDDDKCAASCPRWNGGEDWREEDGDEEDEDDEDEDEDGNDFNGDHKEDEDEEDYEMVDGRA